MVDVAHAAGFHLRPRMYVWVQLSASLLRELRHCTAETAGPGGVKGLSLWKGVREVHTCMLFMHMLHTFSFIVTHVQ
jgi:hypothetical protein